MPIIRLHRSRDQPLHVHDALNFLVQAVELEHRSRPGRIVTRSMAYIVAFHGRANPHMIDMRGIPQRLVKYVAEAKHQKVTTGKGEGEITSGTFSPTLGGLADRTRMKSPVRCVMAVRKRLPKLWPSRPEPFSKR